MKVVFTADAEEDLEEIADYIASDAPKSAKSFTRELVLTAPSLAEAPRIGAKFDDSRFDFRYLTHGSYRIYYSLETDGQIAVVGFIHTARLQSKVFERRLPTER